MLGASGIGARWMRSAPRRSAVLAALVVAGCASPAPIVGPRPGPVSLVGRVVEWTSSQPTLGSVRYGAHAGRYDRVAYPSAVDRGDRRPVASHAVALLGVASGDSVYLQVLDGAADGTVVASGEYGFRVVLAPPPAPMLEWTMIDVGFGDSHLLTMPTTRRRILVDSGERRDEVNVERFLADRGIARLDVAMLTHIHEDHIGGMVGAWGLPDDGVLASVGVGSFLDTATHSGSRSAYDELLALLAARGIPRSTLEPGDTDGDTPALAWDPHVRVAVLNAGHGRSIGGDTENDWINNDSVVMRLTYGSVSLVLGGDAEAPVQLELEGEGAALDAAVLKVHHHGVSDACEPAYLAAVEPRVGLIPIATYESNAGTLPSGIVLDRLGQRSVDVYASDRAGPLGLRLEDERGVNVTVATDGTSYEIRVAPSASLHWPGTTSVAGGVADDGVAPGGTAP